MKPKLAAIVGDLPGAIPRLPVILRLGLFILILLAVWLPLAIPFYWYWGAGNTTSIVTMLILYSEFVILLRLWGKQLYRQARPLAVYGLELSVRNGQELLWGLSLGLGVLLALFGVQAAYRWVVWQTPGFELVQVLLEGLVVSLGIGVAEELLFRGWLLQELERDYSPQAALWINSGVFALLHFIRPLELILQTWTQFLGLVLLGLNLVVAKRLGEGRLGWAIGLHAGLVWGYYMIKVGQLITYSGTAPPWITGINNNPLAGLLGLLWLIGLMLGLQGLSVYRRPSHLR